MTWHNETNNPRKRIARIIVEGFTVFLVLSTIGYCFYTKPKMMSFALATIVGMSTLLAFVDWVTEDDRKDDQP